MFHGNPVYFSEGDCPNPFNPTLTCKKIWLNDALRYKTLFKEHNIKTLIIWESEYKENFDIIKFLQKNGILF
jgi:hypothetical protein